MVSFPEASPPNLAYASLTHTRYMRCPSHSSRFHYTNNIMWGDRSLSSSLRSFLYSSFTSSLLGPNILLCSLFSNTLSLRSSLNISYQVSHTYRTTGEIVILYILIFKFFDSNLEDKRFCIEWKQAFPDFNLPLISYWREFLYVKIFPKYLNSSTLSKEFYQFLYREFNIHGSVHRSMTQ